MSLLLCTYIQIIDGGSRLGASLLVAAGCDLLNHQLADVAPISGLPTGHAGLPELCMHCWLAGWLAGS
ncbi:hypothetical protein B0T17DRAFT_104648 [Bombardia bombarda]|uniref:Uncharacterized protein n=1 Tax=Bombardia bombarda TaxID=252184 RepID=A0AA40CHB7_9PEZI|nr:hypothetical protein B0T17DRAFT_104648 [Bombardia bombarda]